MKDQLMVLMIALVQQKKTVLTLVTQRQNFTKVYIIMAMKVTCM